MVSSTGHKELYDTVISKYRSPKYFKGKEVPSNIRHCDLQVNISYTEKMLIISVNAAHSLVASGVISRQIPAREARNRERCAKDKDQ